MRQKSGAEKFRFIDVDKLIISVNFWNSIEEVTMKLVILKSIFFFILAYTTHIDANNDIVQVPSNDKFAHI